MNSASEIIGSLRGALGLARLDPAGMREFTGTEDAFWRSFFAAILLIPIELGLIMADRAFWPEELGAGRLLAVETILYVIGWTAFPLAAIWLTRMVDREQEYFRYIAAYNWSQVVSTGFLVLVRMLFGTGAGGIALIALAAVLFYEGFITRTALNLPVVVAAGFVAVGFLILMVLHTARLALLAGVPAG